MTGGTKAQQTADSIIRRRPGKEAALLNCRRYPEPPSPPCLSSPEPDSAATPAVAQTTDSRYGCGLGDGGSGSGSG